MSDHKIILRRIGIILIIIGLIDVGVMVYCINNQISYSSSFNIFAILAGIYLYRCNLRVTGWVTWFAAFYSTGFLLGIFILFPFIAPFDYMIFQMKSNPSAFILSVAAAPLVVGLLIWIYVQLRKVPILEARSSSGFSNSAPKSAFISGALLVIVLTALMNLTLNGADATEALRLAQEENGTEYNYYVSALNWSGGHVSATVIAYKEDEAHTLAVEWDK